MILIFISRFDNKKIITNIHSQLYNLSKLVDVKINVLFESSRDYNHINQIFKDSNIINQSLNIIDIDYVKKKTFIDRLKISIQQALINRLHYPGLVTSLSLTHMLLIRRLSFVFEQKY